MRANVQTLANVQLGPGQPFSIEVPDVDLLNAIVSVHFDEKTVVRGQNSAVFKYEDAGNFLVQVVVIRPGQVNRFSFEAVVSGETKAAVSTVRITVPGRMKKAIPPHSGNGQDRSAM